VIREDIEKVSQLEILASSDTAGVYIVEARSGRQVFVMGHSELTQKNIWDILV
jgi:homoserine O-succinyltransferase